MGAKIACLLFKPEGLPWLIVEDTECDRRAAIEMIFGEPNAAGEYDEYQPKQVVVKRVTRTRAYLDKLPEWEP